MKKKKYKFIHIRILFNFIVLSGFFLLANKKTNNSKIYQVDNLNYLYKQINNFDNNTLIIFDVINTLLYRTDQFFNTKKNPKYIFFRELHKLTNNLDKKKQLNIWYQIKLQAKKKLIDKQTPKLIKKLQNKKFKVIALTKMGKPTDKTKDIFENARINDLSDHEITFKDAFPKIKNLKLNYIKNEAKPIFKKGILFSNTKNKGKVLGLFLDKINWKPNKVIFIDDHALYINSVAKEMQKRNINFVGLHYIKHNKFIKKLNKSLFNFQLNYFLKYKKWLNDSIAINMK